MSFTIKNFKSNIVSFCARPPLKKELIVVSLLVSAILYKNRLKTNSSRLLLMVCFLRYATPFLFTLFKSALHPSPAATKRDAEETDQPPKSPSLANEDIYISLQKGQCGPLVPAPRAAAGSLLEPNPAAPLPKPERDQERTSGGGAGCVAETFADEDRYPASAGAGGPLVAASRAAVGSFTTIDYSEDPRLKFFNTTSQDQKPETLSKKITEFQSLHPSSYGTLVLDKRSVVVLSSNPGGGHKMAAKTIGMALCNAGWEVHHIHYNLSANTDTIHKIISKIEEVRARCIVSTVYHASPLNYQFFSAITNLPTLVFCTDYSGPFHKNVKEISQVGLVHFAIPAPVKGADVEKVLGYPVRKELKSRLSFEEIGRLKLKYDIPLDKTIILISSTDRFSPQGEYSSFSPREILVSCHFIINIREDNESDLPPKCRPLGDLFAQTDGKLTQTLIPYCNEMHELFHVADIIAIKPGGSSCAEMVAIKRIYPEKQILLMLLNGIKLHEQANASYLHERAIADVFTGGKRIFVVSSDQTRRHSTFFHTAINNIMDRDHKLLSPPDFTDLPEDWESLFIREIEEITTGR